MGFLFSDLQHLMMNKRASPIVRFSCCFKRLNLVRRFSLRLHNFVRSCGRLWFFFGSFDGHGCRDWCLYWEEKLRRRRWRWDDLVLLVFVSIYLFIRRDRCLQMRVDVRLWRGCTPVERGPQILQHVAGIWGMMVVVNCLLGSGNSLGSILVGGGYCGSWFSLCRVKETVWIVFVIPCLSRDQALSILHKVLLFWSKPPACPIYVCLKMKGKTYKDQNSILGHGCYLLGYEQFEKNTFRRFYFNRSFFFFFSSLISCLVKRVINLLLYIFIITFGGSNFLQSLSCFLSSNLSMGQIPNDVKFEDKQIITIIIKCLNYLEGYINSVFLFWSFLS